MSDYLYPNRLRCEGDECVLRANGVTTHLPAAPQLANKPVAEVLYTPAVREARIRLRQEAWRDMHSDEIAAAEALIKRHAKA